MNIWQNRSRTKLNRFLGKIILGFDHGYMKDDDDDDVDKAVPTFCIT